MKNLLYLISALFLFTSCENEAGDLYSSYNDEYSMALDSLANYDNYFIGEFNGELLVSTKLFNRGLGVGNTLQDSVSIQYSYAYRISNSEELKTPFINFIAYDSKSKLDSTNNYRFNEYKDFYNFFNGDELNYFELDDFKNTETKVIIRYNDYSQLINNTGLVFQSSDFNVSPFNENNFFIESIREIDTPSKGIELTYSFNCILFSEINSDELIEIKKGKGKCSFFY